MFNITISCGNCSKGLKQYCGKLGEKIREWLSLSHVDPHPHIELGIRSREHHIAELINKSKNTHKIKQYPI